MPTSRLLKATEPSPSTCVRPLVVQREADTGHLKPKFSFSPWSGLHPSQESTFFIGRCNFLWIYIARSRERDLDTCNVCVVLNRELKVIYCIFSCCS